MSQVASLKRLHLGFNELGDEGVAAVMAPFFASRNVIVDLSLDGNAIDDSGVDTLLMARLPCLKQLSLKEIGDVEEETKKKIISGFGKGVVSFGDEEEEP